MLIMRSLIDVAPPGPALLSPPPLPGDVLLIVLIPIERLLQGHDGYCDHDQDQCAHNFHTSSYFSAGLQAAYDEGIFDLSFGS